ncbi:MAG: sigma 54-interacting transcriptional regulator [Firmicutes bacterium]|nr:sigma 54-interacting transcriptional regulator [Bacillota bacterium]
MKKEEYKKILEELLKLIDEGVYIVDKKGVGKFYNEAMASMEKMNVDDVLGKTFYDAFPQVGNSTMMKALTKGESTVNQQQAYKNFYGKEISTVNSTIPIIVDGETVAALEVAKDVTNIRKVSDTLMELQKGGMTAGAGTNQKNSKIKRYSFEDIYGKNQAFADVVERAKRAADIDASVFIYGETGTGKELFAQSIHYDGIRSEKPFLAQNCAAIPEALLEGILFGTSKGSFTGAVDREGLFEQANGGTLLLDEISAMPYDLQSKLLRVLQEQYIRRVGGTKDIPINVRIIATVNEAPEDLIAQGKLRKDLYYRLNVVNISIPPLRDRLEDIPLLAERFLEKHNQRFKKEIWMVSDAALKKLKNYDYPGNVRELENIIEQAVSMADKEHVLNEKILQMPSATKKSKTSQIQYENVQPLDVYMSEMESNIIKDALLKCGGNVSKTAELLQIKRQTLQHKLKKYRITE